MSTRNQISGSITFDVASLADAIATRLQQPASSTPGPIPLSLSDAIEAVLSSLPNGISSSRHGGDRRAIAKDIAEMLATSSVTFVRHTPAAPVSERDWFSRHSDS